MSNTTASGTLYEAAVEISNEYLGPAGERFIRRQITTHLKTEPEKLKTNDIEVLVGWVRLTFAVLTDDKEQVEDFANRLLSLSPKTKIPKKARNRNNHKSV